MYLLGLGLLLLVMKYLEMVPVDSWDWWVVLAPFGAAVCWWAWADWSGYTKRRAVERDNTRRQSRIDKTRESLGMLSKKKKP